MGTESLPKQFKRGWRCVMAEIVRRGGGYGSRRSHHPAPHENFNRARECCECIIDC